MATRAYVGLGANLGDPPAQLRAALAALGGTRGVRVLACSHFYRTAPIGPAAQPEYCNAVAMLETLLAPQALMDALLAIERAAGRVRDGTRWGPRRLDLDLLHYEGVVQDRPGLTLPHPELGRRSFVLVPLAQVAPGLDIPGLGLVDAAARRIGRDGLAPWRE